MIREFGTVRYFQFDSLASHGVTHGIFLRVGGVSPSYYSSLNVGGSVGDNPENVRENIKRSFDAINRPVQSKYDVFQVHGNNVVSTQNPRIDNTPLIESDGILTDSEDVTLFMRFADCVPILLYDPRHHVVGLGHAGWQGTSLGVATNLIDSLHYNYGSQPGEIIAGIGPSIGPSKYEVGIDVARQIENKFGTNAPEVLIHKKGKIFLDLWTANKILLMSAGVRNIEVSGICTASNTGDWFSHRAENGLTGRFGGAIALQ